MIGVCGISVGLCETNLRQAIFFLAIFLVGVGLCLGVGGGCASRVDALTRQLESKDPAERIRAVHAIGTEQIDGLLPALVNRLDDDDVAVRLYTIVALEKLTGERLGFEYSGESKARQTAVKRWRRYVASRAGSEPSGLAETRSGG